MPSIYTLRCHSLRKYARQSAKPRPIRVIARRQSYGRRRPRSPWEDPGGAHAKDGPVKARFIGIGIFLAIGVLWWFLRRGRATMLVALAIPVSVLATFVVLNLAGRTLNVISLAGIAFAVGMVVGLLIGILVARHWKAGKRAVFSYLLSQNIAALKKRLIRLGFDLLDPDESAYVDTLLSDITSDAILSATGAHWEESQRDYFAMNTDTRSTAIVLAALARLDPDNALIPNVDQQQRTTQVLQGGSTIYIDTDGVVLRGEGQQDSGGTRITCTATDQISLIKVGGSGSGPTRRHRRPPSPYPALSTFQTAFERIRVHRPPAALWTAFQSHAYDRYRFCENFCRSSFPPI